MSLKELFYTSIFCDIHVIAAVDRHAEQPLLSVIPRPLGGFFSSGRALTIVAIAIVGLSRTLAIVAISISGLSISRSLAIVVSVGLSISRALAIVAIPIGLSLTLAMAVVSGLSISRTLAVVAIPIGLGLGYHCGSKDDEEKDQLHDELF